MYRVRSKRRVLGASGTTIHEKATGSQSDRVACCHDLPLVAADASAYWNVENREQAICMVGSCLKRVQMLIAYSAD